MIEMSYYNTPLTLIIRPQLNFNRLIHLDKNNLRLDGVYRTIHLYIYESLPIQHSLNCLY